MKTSDKKKHPSPRKKPPRKNPPSRRKAWINKMRQNGTQPVFKWRGE